MTPETEQNINEAIDWLQKTGGAIQDFTAEQSPLYCKEVIAWELWSSVAGAVLGTVMFVTAIVALVIFVKGMRKYHGEPNGVTVSAIFIGIVCIVGGIALPMNYVPRAIKAIVAPRMVVVEHFRGLTK
jgi:hypothetical protein